MDLAKHHPVQTWDDLQRRLDAHLTSIQKEEANAYKAAIRAGRLCREFVQSLQASLIGYTFGPGEEVHFYKTVKPYFFGRLLYYDRLYEMDIERSLTPPNAVEAFYERELDRLTSVYKQHRFIATYLNSGATYLDDRLFFHETEAGAIALYGKDLPDAGGRVCYDHVVAQLIAADLMKEYILQKLEDLRQHAGISDPGAVNVVWTDSKTALIELAYALQSAGVLNNGKIDLKDVVDFLQRVFRLNLGNYPRTFQEILARKTGYTNFIDRLRDKLLLRIQQIEEKYDP